MTMLGDRQIAVDKVRSIMLSQYSVSVKVAQTDYDWLRGWCEGRNYDFLEVFNGALAHLLKTEVLGIHSWRALSGAPRV